MTIEVDGGSILVSVLQVAKEFAKLKQIHHTYGKIKQAKSCKLRAQYHIIVETKDCFNIEGLSKIILTCSTEHSLDAKKFTTQDH